MRWDKLSREAIEATIFEALGRNTNYAPGQMLGFPGSTLDKRVFPRLPFIDESPFLTCLLENPNHIGCHTLGAFEPVFAGTQALEREVMQICSEELLGARVGSCDGYVTPGGTEANLQALWIYRNLFRQQEGAVGGEVGVLYSADTHYSIPKAIDILGLVSLRVPVDENTRQMARSDIEGALEQGRSRGVRFVIAVLNMGTTMFGSVDDEGPVLDALEAAGHPYRVHVDAAFGGFIYPLTTPRNSLSFANPKISSVTLDAHKMLQAPYGTGIFLANKGLMAHVHTAEAEYVHGTDYTVCGSRSGANAVAIWMILRAYGSEGGLRFVGELLRRTDLLCGGLDSLGLSYFRQPGMNIVTLRAAGVPSALAERFHLVPDTHHGSPGWWKIVVMDHVEDSAIATFLEAFTCSSWAG